MAGSIPIWRDSRYVTLILFPILTPETIIPGHRNPGTILRFPDHADPRGKPKFNSLAFFPHLSAFNVLRSLLFGNSGGAL